MKRANKILALALSYALIASTIFVSLPVAVNAAPVTPTQTVLKDGESKIVKTAEPVKGEVNKWRVTVRAEYNPIRKPTDVLVVLDRSGSMADGEREADGTVRENVPVDEQRMTNAKIGIQELTNRVLEQNKDNKVALYSYSYGFANNRFYESLTKHTGFTQNPEDIKNALTPIQPQGGTFTQMALHEADKAMSELKKQDTDGKRNRVVVLVTDGKPTVGYKVDIAKLSKEEGGLGNFFEWRTNIKSTSDYPQYYNDAVQNASDGSTTSRTSYMQNGRYYMVGYGVSQFGSNFAARDAWVSNGKIPASTFIYSNGNPNTQEGRSNILNRIGWGCDIQYAMYGIDNQGRYMYWDIPENTVIEANAIKEAGNINDLYVVGLVTDDETNAYLKRMASPDKFYPSSSKNFQKTINSILDQIKGDISIDESLKDIIGDGFAEPTEIKTTKGEAKYIKSADGTDNGHIDWKIGQPTQIKDENAPESDKVYYEELSYVLTMKDGWEKGGDKTLKTNGKTEVTVEEKFKEEVINKTTAEAISPEVDPIKLTIEKELKGADGANPAFPDENFEIKISGPDGSNYAKTVNLKKDGNVAIGDLKLPGTYKITEGGNYDKKIKITSIDAKNGNETTIEADSFTINGDGSVKISGGKDVASYVENDIKIVITNTEKKVKIGDYVWNDANNDGIQDTTEKPIKDVVVKLLDKDGNPVKDRDGKEIKATTDADGKYLFEVAPGEYKVEIVAPDGYGMSNNQPKTTDNFVMKSGESDLTKDFGLVKAKTYKVTHEFKVANDSSIKEFPAGIKAEVEKQLPETQTGKKNRAVVEPGALKNPGEVEDKANDGKWKFKAFIDQDPATEKVDAKIDNADVNFVGEWTFVPNKHNVTYEYKSGTTGMELPDALKGKAPKPATGKVRGDKVTSPVPQGKDAEFRDEANKGTWKFKSYDKKDVTIVDKDEHVVGTWVFEKDPAPKTYKVTHKFESEDPNVDLPEAVKKLTPSDQKGKADGSKVNPTEPKTKKVETNEGTWTFTGYDKAEKTVDGKDVEFIGKWKFTPKTYKVTHEFKVAKDSSIKEFPAGVKAEVEKQLPETETGKKNGTVVEPGALKNKADVEDKANDGKWKFTNFIDQDPATEKVDAKIDNADVNFVGEWTFVPNKHNVTYEYKSGTKGMELPDALKKKAPSPATDKVKGDKVTSPVPTGADATFRDEANKGTWKFKSYDKSDVTIVDKDEHVVGTWVFEKDSKPAVDGKDNPSSKDKPTTGDKGLELLFMSIVLMMSAGATVSLKKRKSNQDR